MKFRKKPVVIEAFKWTGDEKQIEDPVWMVDTLRNFDAHFNYDGTVRVSMTIKTLEGNMTASRGDYIIQGVNGEIYPCKPDIFTKTYEEVK